MTVSPRGQETLSNKFTVYGVYVGFLLLLFVCLFVLRMLLCSFLPACSKRVKMAPRRDNDAGRSKKYVA